MAMAADWWTATNSTRAAITEEIMMNEPKVKTQQDRKRKKQSTWQKMRKNKTKEEIRIHRHAKKLRAMNRRLLAQEAAAGVDEE